MALSLSQWLNPFPRLRLDYGHIPDRPLGKGTDHTWRPTRRASSLRSRANRRKARRRVGRSHTAR